MDYGIIEVRPKQLRFTQDSIADHFNREFGNIFYLEDAFRQLRDGFLHAHDFPMLEVAKDERGVLWSNDNRRLWLFREAGVAVIQVKLYYRPLSRAPPEPHLRELMAGEDYFPRIRWSKNCSSLRSELKRRRHTSCRPKSESPVIQRELPLRGNGGRGFETAPLHPSEVVAPSRVKEEVIWRPSGASFSRENIISSGGKKEETRSEPVRPPPLSQASPGKSSERRSEPVRPPPSSRASSGNSSETSTDIGAAEVAIMIGAVVGGIIWGVRKMFGG